MAFHGWLLAAIAAAVENLPDAANSIAQYTVEGSQPWLQMAAEVLHGLYGWLLAAIAVAVENLPDAAKSVAGSTAEASQPWLAMGSLRTARHGRKQGRRESPRSRRGCHGRSSRLLGRGLQHALAHEWLVLSRSRRHCGVCRSAGRTLRRGLPPMPDVSCHRRHRQDVALKLERWP
ncbi:hypothetical protein ABZP36_018727 [Zizania latifolia]